MKNLFIILGLIFLTLTSKAQLTLEHSFTTSSPISSFNTNSKGIMYYEYEIDTTNKFNIYNEDFSIYKTITIDRPVGYFIQNKSFSEQLFNLDNSIEFLCIFEKFDEANQTSTFIMKLYDENGTILKDFGTYNSLASYQTNILSDGNTNKLYISRWLVTSTNPRKYQITYELYTLPGNIPNSVSELKVSNIPSAYPNPAKTIINLPYILDKNQTTIMRIYKMNGQLIEQKQIDSNFDNIKLKVGSYQSGMYFYEYNGISKKFVVN